MSQLVQDLLLNLAPYAPYKHLLDLCDKYPEFRAICYDDRLWHIKVEKDFPELIHQKTPFNTYQLLYRRHVEYLLGRLFTSIYTFPPANGVLNIVKPLFPFIYDKDIDNQGKKVYNIVPDYWVVESNVFNPVVLEKYGYVSGVDISIDCHRACNIENAFMMGNVGVTDRNETIRMVEEYKALGFLAELTDDQYRNKIVEKLASLGIIEFRRKV